MFSSSKCANVITLHVCSFEDVAYGVYVTAGRIAIASEYGRDVYDNVLETISSKTTSYDDITFLVLGTGYVHEILFLMLWNINKDAAKPFLCLMTHV